MPLAALKKTPKRCIVLFCSTSTSLPTIQTLNLLTVPTQSQDYQSSEQDFYLHLNLPPELDLPLPAHTQIFHQPPRSYLIPRLDVLEGGAFTRIEFPPLGRGVQQEDIDTFETILAQCTTFAEKVQAPKTEKSSSSSSIKAYNPAEYKPSQAYAYGTANAENEHGHVVLVNEDNGSVVGEISPDAAIMEDSTIRPGEKGMF
jgi:spartin